MKLTNTYVHETLDSVTGEVVKSEKKFTYVKKHIKKKFVMVSFDSKWYKNLKGSDVLVLFELLDHENRETFLIHADKHFRKDVKETLELSDAQITVCLRRLISEDLIKRVGRGSYMINPDCIWVGNEKMLEKRLDKWVELTVNAGEI